MPVSTKPQCTEYCNFGIVNFTEIKWLCFVSTFAFWKWLFQGNALAHRNDIDILGMQSNQNRNFLEGWYSWGIKLCCKSPEQPPFLGITYPPQKCIRSFQRSQCVLSPHHHHSPTLFPHLIPSRCWLFSTGNYSFLSVTPLIHVYANSSFISCLVYLLLMCFNYSSTFILSWREK